MRTVLLSLVLLGCPGSEPAEPPEPALETVEDAPAPSQMTEHFLQLSAAKEAMIRGDVPRAKAQLKWVATHDPEEPLPAGWRPATERMKAAARAGASAQTPQGVGRGVAAAALTCGECHTTLNTPVEFNVVPPPTAKAGVIGHMAEHAWVAERMWQGLVGPSDGAWAEAVEVLARGSLLEAPEGKLMSEEARAFAAQVHEDGMDTLTAASPQERLALFGDFLAACGGCHVQTGGGPAAPPPPAPPADHP